VKIKYFFYFLLGIIIFWIGTSILAPNLEPTSPPAKKFYQKKTPLPRESEDNTYSDEEEYEEEPEGKVELEDMDCVPSSIGMYATGHITNNTNYRVTLFVHVNFYDEDGVLVDQGIDSVHDLPPGETWEFKAAGINSKAVDCEVTKITGYKSQ